MEEERTEKRVPAEKEAPPPAPPEVIIKEVEPSGPGEAPPTPPPKTPEADETSSGHKSNEAAEN